MQKLRIAVAGATGFVGKKLTHSLLNEGHFVIGLSRRQIQKNESESIQWRKCDLFSLKDTKAALREVDIAFYLTHSMNPSARLAQGNFADYDLILADNFARAARHNKLKQIVYLGGIIPEDLHLSRHLLSRLEVERTLKTSGVQVTSLRMGIILGSEGSSFRIMYNLVKRLPIMVCPSWTLTLSNPIYIEDAIKALQHCVGNERCFDREFDIGGKTTLSYIDMMKELAKKLKKNRFFLVIPFFSPHLSRLWVRTITQAPKDLVYPLVGSLKTHMVPNINRTLPEIVNHFMSYEQALDKILKEKNGLNQLPKAFEKETHNSNNMVRSIKRVESLYRFHADETANLYFKWLNDLVPWVRVRKMGSNLEIGLFGIKKPLIELEKNIEVSSRGICIYVIKGGLLSKNHGRGRLIFRSVIEGRYTMVEIQEFIPRLPWFLYKYSQAVIHEITMMMFNKYILKISRNTKNNKFNA